MRHRRSVQIQVSSRPQTSERLLAGDRYAQHGGQQTGAGRLLSGDLPGLDPHLRGLKASLDVDFARLGCYDPQSGRAWCPSVATDGVCRAQDVDNPSMTSVGAELNLDTWLLLDTQAKFRMGVAFPLTNRDQLGANGAQAYATFGASF